MAFVEFRNVRKVYQMGDVEVRAVDGMDFEIERGELVVIVGQPRAVEIAVARNETSSRCTRLAERLSGCAPCG